MTDPTTYWDREEMRDIVRAESPPEPEGGPEWEADHTIGREAWDIASVLVAEYLDEGEPPHRPAGTNEIFIKEAERAARLNGLEPGQATWSELIHQQVLYVQGSIHPDDLRRELTQLGLYVMQWLHDLNDNDPVLEIVVEDRGDQDAGEVSAG
jgi:hypothetical protein